nr:TetR/AcrR family transcriptional regulator [Streptomyces sp. SID11385]
MIVAAARRIADAEGLDALTVRRVAHALGTGPASLYRHFADREELLGLLARDVAERLTPLARAARQAEGAPAVRLEVLWRESRDALAAHPWAVRIIAEGVHVVDEAAPFAEAVLALLASAGLAPGEARAAYRALWDFLIGHLLNAHPVGHGSAAPSGADDYAWALPRLLRGLLAE